MRRLGLILGCSVLAVLPVRGQQAPPDWKWRTDAPAVLSNDAKPPDGSWQFTTMAPGWHITTRPGVLLYPTTTEGRGHFAVQSEIFLFPGESLQEYGLFVAGRQLDPAGSVPTYLAFVARRDGQAAVLRRTSTGIDTVVAWAPNDAVVPHPGGTTGTAKNVLRVDVGAAEIVFSANGKDVARIPRAGVDTDGAIGFRVGAEMNLHVSTLDVTYKLAPVPVKR